MRRTRIISTVGPASNRPDLLRALILAGTDAFRLNFSHGTRQEHADVCGRIRAAATELDRPIAILQDLAGPKIRIGALERPIDLNDGQPLTIEYNADYDRSVAGNNVTTAFAALFTSVSPGARLLVDEGRIELEVLAVSANRIETRVITPGRLDSHKGINVPGVILQTPAMTEKDEADLRAGIAMGVDIVGVSFVQTPDDLRRVREAARAAGAPDLPIVAKIEKPLAVDRIEEIAGQSDGLMVARGDLGIEMPLEVIPAVQKRVIGAARERGVPVTVATQVLESMRTSPRPTRAEVTDAAHAVDEGADAIMLAGETAIGKYPVESVTTLDRILREAERAPIAPSTLSNLHADWAPHGRALCEAAVALASRAGAAAIVAVTEAGRTARLLSALRPRARILAAASTAAVAARLNVIWGVTPFVSPPDPAEARRLLLDRGLVTAGSVVVFVSIGTALGRADANFVHVETL